jgi:hypothetical protein
LALAEQKDAEAAYADALAKANEAKAQLDVYALDPSYKSAMGKAPSRVNGVLKQHNLQFTMPKPGGTLSEAQDRLKQRHNASRKATKARQEYAHALKLLRQLPPVMCRGLPFQPFGPVVTSGDGEGYDTMEARRRSAHAVGGSRSRARCDASSRENITR